MVNDQLAVKNLVTDVLIGCDPWFASFGKISDVHMFDRVLSSDEMLGMTSCDGKKVEGNILNSNIDAYSIYGFQVNKFNVHSEEICPKKQFRQWFY